MDNLLPISMNNLLIDALEDDTFWPVVVYRIIYLTTHLV